MTSLSEMTPSPVVTKLLCGPAPNLQLAAHEALLSTTHRMWTATERPGSCLGVVVNFVTEPSGGICETGDEIAVGPITTCKMRTASGIAENM